MALTPQNTKQSKSTQLHDYRHIMLIRMLLFCVAAINVTTYFVLQGGQLQLILVFALLCYPVLTRRLLRLTLNSSNGGFRRMLLPTLDGLAIGLAIIGVHIALVPTLAIATAAVSCMLIIGGVRLWLWSLTLDLRGQGPEHDGHGLPAHGQVDDDAGGGVEVEFLEQHVADLRCPVVQRQGREVESGAGGFVVDGQARRGGIGPKQVCEKLHAAPS